MLPWESLSFRTFGRQLESLDVELEWNLDVQAQNFGSVCSPPDLYSPTTRPWPTTRRKSIKVQTTCQHGQINQSQQIVKGVKYLGKPSAGVAKKFKAAKQPDLAISSFSGLLKSRARNPVASTLLDMSAEDNISETNSRKEPAAEH